MRYSRLICEGIFDITQVMILNKLKKFTINMSNKF